MADTLSLSDIKRRVRERLTQLQPLVDEYAELERVASNLRVESEQPKPQRRQSTARSKRQRAPRGANKDKVYAVIAERPGVSVAEIASVSGVDKPMIYNVTRTAIQKGEIEKVDLGGGRSGFKMSSRDGSPTNAARSSDDQHT